MSEQKSRVEPFEIELTAVITKEGAHYVSQCLELDIASCGDSVEEAFRNLEDATMLYLSTLDETGQLQRVFEEIGIKTQEPSFIVRYPVRTDLKNVATVLKR